MINYKILVNSKETGPYTFNQLRAMWNNGTLTCDALYRIDENDEWDSINNIGLDSSLQEVDAELAIKEQGQHQQPLNHEIRHTVPIKTTTAVKLLYTSLLIGVISGLIELSRLPEGAPVGFVLLVIFSGLCFGWFVTWRIGKGDNFARIFNLIMVIIFVPFGIFSGLLGLAQTVIQVVALVLLFGRESSAWFKAMKKSKVE